MKNSNFWMLLTFILGAVLIASFFFDINFSITPKSKSKRENSPSATKQPVAKVNTAEIQQNIVCGCCGKSIADCNCGMAKERKAFVDEQAAKGLNERSLYKEAIKKFGQAVLFDQALAAEIKKELIAEAPEDRPAIAIEPESIDLGKVSMAKGKVQTVFKVKNLGQSDLIITGMETSCGCTTVTLKIDGRQSPVFGMSDNPTDWSESLAPGQEGELVAIFDPGHHGPKGTGPATRTISVQSNDPLDSFKKVQFEVDVSK